METIHKTSSDKPHMVFCGGFHSSMQGVKAEFLCDLCRQQGWGFTRFDYRGHGVSDGIAEYCSLHDWLNDTLAVLADLQEKVILIGSSMGAWLAVLASIRRCENVCALLTIAAAPDFTEKLLWPALSIQQQQAINNDACVYMPTHYDGDDWRIRRHLFKSGRDLAILATDEPLKLTIPVRMLHGTLDSDVPWALSQQLLERFTYSKSATLTLIQGADHRLSDERCLDEIRCALLQLINC